MTLNPLPRLVTFSWAPRALAPAGLALALFFTGCLVDGSEASTGDTEAPDKLAFDLEARSSVGSISGSVRRTSALAPGNDGIGTLYIGAFASCSHTAPLLGKAIVSNANLSQACARVGFRIEALPRETVYLAAFLDDNGDANPAAPLPAAGDPVFASDVHDGILDCVPAEPGKRGRIQIELNTLED